ILEWFPEARFIYITRNPIHILNSQLNAMLTLLSGEQPFQTMLIDNFKVPGNLRLIMPIIYAGWKLVRSLKALVGNAFVAWLVRPFAVLSLQSQLKSYYKDLKTLPPQHVYQLTYNDFNTDPVNKLKELQAFLDLPFTESPESIKPKPRSGHLSENLKKYEPRLMKKLKKILGHSADVENKNLETS
ncbi:MAG TPA: sulfotransferase domain-containing protein, partial [Pseudomonadales bacterium]|nr:sulfotransferase domain-containing protein [Pseudomonadales bacterium]